MNLLDANDRTALYQAFSDVLEQHEAEPRDHPFYLMQMAGICHAIYCAENESSRDYLLDGIKILVRAFKEAATRTYDKEMAS